MNTFAVLYGKELLEAARSYKAIWLPVVFMLLCGMQPVMIYFLPQILSASGSLPPGTVLEIPTPSGGEVLAQTLQQLNTMGLLVVVLAFMGIVSNERNSGALALVMVKPVSTSALFGAKLAAIATFIVVAFGLGYAAAVYYTVLLIEPVSIGGMMKSMLLYLVWLLWVGLLTMFASAWLNSAGAAAFAVLGLAAVLMLLTGLFPAAMAFSPAKLPAFAAEAAVNGNWSGPVWKAVLMTGISGCVLFVVGRGRVRLR